VVQVPCKEETRNDTKFWLKIEKRPVGNLDIDGVIILKWVLGK
jgi:hypothetical protein